MKGSKAVLYKMSYKSELVYSTFLHTKQSTNSVMMLGHFPWKKFDTTGLALLMTFYGDATFK